MVRLASALALLAAGEASAQGAHDASDGLTAELSWRAEHAGCLQADALIEATEQRLSRDVFVEQGADVRVLGTLSPTDDGGFRAQLEMHDLAGNVLGVRELRSEGCADLDASLPLVVALMVDVERDSIVLQVPPPEPVPVPAMPVPATMPVPAPVPVGSAERAQVPAQKKQSVPGTGLSVGLAVGAQVGTLPELPVLLGLRLEVRPRGWFPLQLSALQVAPYTSREEVGGALVWGTLVQLGACPGQLRLGPDSELLGCLALGAGRRAVDGVGFDVENRSADGWLAELTPALELRARLWRVLRIGLRPELLVSLVKQRFVYQEPAGQSVLFESSTLGGRLLVSLALVVPG